jgi:hypothetical protein
MDWHRLLEICALTETLILDEDGLYDPAHFNDRLLLGLKGTMSEAELHVLRARLRGGIVNKARRGELEVPLPVGFVYDTAGRVGLDPDRQVQETLRTFFQTFRRTGSATATVKAFRDQQIAFPRRARYGAHQGETLWGRLEHSRVLWVLHNPRYAGAFFFGRSRQRHTADARLVSERLPREEWTALIPNAHVGYITWEDFEENQRRLRENAQANGADRRRSPPREGPALLQGLAVCGICGDRMTVRYHRRQGTAWPTYVCQRRGIAQAEPICQSIPGRGLDHAIGRVLLETVTLQQVTEAQEISERQRQADRVAVDADARARILALATDFPRLWHDPHTPDRERKRMVRLLMDDVTLIKAGDGLTAHVRFRGGATTTLTLARALNAWQLRETSAEIVALIDHLLDSHADRDIATILNARGYVSGTGQPFQRGIVKHIRHGHHLRSLYERLRSRGLLTRDEMADRLPVSADTVKIWGRHGLLPRHRCNDKDECLYEPPGPNAPIKMQGRRLSDRRRPDVLSDQTSEVQYEA